MTTPKPTPPIPTWDTLPSYAQEELEKASCGKPWWEQNKDDATRLSVLTIYVKMRGLGLWPHVGQVLRTPIGRIEFKATNVDTLRSALRNRNDFTTHATRSYGDRMEVTIINAYSSRFGDGHIESITEGWESRESRHKGALHLKHFARWGYDEAQAHIDQSGLRDASGHYHCLDHAWSYLTDDYQEVFQIRELLLGQGWDPAPLRAPTSEKPSK